MLCRYLVAFSSLSVLATTSRGLLLAGYLESPEQSPHYGAGCRQGLQSPDPSLVCCQGLALSTLIGVNERCCNGQALAGDELCCGDTTPVVRADPSHNACCLNPTDDTFTTYNATRFYCSLSTGQLIPLPGIQRWPSALRSLLSSRGSLATSDRDRRCGDTPFNPAVQMCCAGVLHNLSPSQGMCCYEQAFRADDRENPCLVPCGTTHVNLEHEICCQGIKHQASSHETCCGPQKIDTRTHTCCADGLAPLPRYGFYGCCQDQTPFLKHYMRCSGSGTLVRRNQEFNSRRLCRQRLPVWGQDWASPILSDDLLQLQGSVQNVTIRHNMEDDTLEVHLTLERVAVVGSGSWNHTACPLFDRPLHVIADVENNGRQHCTSSKADRRQLSRYLANKNLILITDADSLDCSSAMPALHFPRSSSQHLMLLGASRAQPTIRNHL